MKSIKIILFILLSVSLVGIGNAQRNIILSHGFEGSDASWNVYHPFLRGLLTTPEIRRVSFNSLNGVGAGVDEVSPQVSDNSQNITIAHSMGGIIWRTLDVAQPGRKAGGIITLGSPNRGSAALKAFREGGADNLLQDGCNKIGNAVTTTFFASWALGLGGNYTFGLAESLGLFQNAICTEITNSLSITFPTVTAPNSVRDMAEGSNVINVLNNSNTPTFKIGLFGVECSPVHMRLFGSLKNLPTKKPLGVSNTDEHMVIKFRVAEALTITAGAIFLVQAIRYSYCAVWNWCALIPAMACAWAAYEWAVLTCWLAQSESKWHAIIGAGGFFVEMVNSRIFSCGRDLNTIFHAFARGQITSDDMEAMRANLFADPNCFTTRQIPVTFPINNQSDGLFNAGTARIPTDPNSISHVVNLQVSEANHQELLNHPEMTQTLIDIFAGRRGVAPFFITN